MFERQPTRSVEKMMAEHVVSIASLFEKKYGLAVQPEELPRVELRDIKGANYVHKDENGQLENVIEVRTEDDIMDGETIGEEMGHFYRLHAQSDSHESLTGEFFGWLGRRMLYSASKEEGNPSGLFFDGEPSLEKSFGSKDGFLKKIKVRTQRLRVLFNEFNATREQDRQQEILDEAIPLHNERKFVTGHYRGYEFAARVDLSKIKNWPKLYSLPDAEVRQRFFTDNPDYSGL